MREDRIGAAGHGVVEQRRVDQQAVDFVRLDIDDSCVSIVDPVADILERSRSEPGPACIVRAGFAHHDRGESKSCTAFVGLDPDQTGIVL